MSRLPLSLGIQKQWMTSRLVPRTSTFVPVGMTIWPLVTIGRRSMPPQPSWRRVVDLPPPLLAGDVDVALGVVGLGQRHQRADRRDGDTDQDQAGRIVRRDLQGRLAVRLLGDRLAAIAELEHGPTDRREHEQHDDAGDQEDRPLQVLDLLGVLAGGLPGVLRGVLGAARQEGEAEDARDGDRGGAPAAPGGTRHAVNANRAVRERPLPLVDHGTTTSTRAPSTPGTTNS